MLSKFPVVGMLKIALLWGRVVVVSQSSLETTTKITILDEPYLVEWQVINRYKSL